MNVFLYIKDCLRTLYSKTIKFLNKMASKLFRGSCHTCGNEAGRFIATDTDYLLKKNFLHEFDTEEEKKFAREGLGIDLKKIAAEVEKNLGCEIKTKFEALLGDINLLVDGKIAKSSIYAYLEKIEDRLKELQTLTNSTYLLSSNRLSEFDTDEKKEQARNNLGINLTQILGDIERLKNSAGTGGGGGVSQSDLDAVKQRIQTLESNPILSEQALQWFQLHSTHGPIVGKLELRDGAFVLNMTQEEAERRLGTAFQFIAENNTDQAIPAKSIGGNESVMIPARSWSLVRYYSGGGGLMLDATVSLPKSTGGLIKGVYSTYRAHGSAYKHVFSPELKGITEDENDLYIIENHSTYEADIQTVTGSGWYKLPADTTGIFRFYNGQAECVVNWINSYREDNDVFPATQKNIEDRHISGDAATLNVLEEIGPATDGKHTYVTQNLTNVAGKIVNEEGRTVIEVAPGETVLYKILEEPTFGDPFASGSRTISLKSRIKGSVSSGSQAAPYTLPAATSAELGGVKVGASVSGQVLPVKLNESNQAYVDANDVKSAIAGSLPRFEIITDYEYNQKKNSGQLVNGVLYFIKNG